MAYNRGYANEKAIHMCNVTFLGVRGSTPCPAPAYMVYGGHTSSIMVELENQLLVFDAGSGLFSANGHVGKFANKNVKQLRDIL